MAAAAPLADERLQWLLLLQMRGVLPMDGHSWQTGGTHGRQRQRVVSMTAMRATKKARGLRATRVRAMRVIMETSPREEGDDGHNN